MKWLIISIFISTSAFADYTFEFCQKITIHHNHPQGIHVQPGKHDAELENSSKFFFTLSALEVEEAIVIHLDSGSYIDSLTLIKNCENSERDISITLE